MHRVCQNPTSGSESCNLSGTADVNYTRLKERIFGMGFLLYNHTRRYAQ